jgi:uncharacterized membrane protein
VSFPSAAKGVFHFKDAKAFVRALLLQMVGLTDSRYARTNNQYVKVRLILNVCLPHDISP